MKALKWIVVIAVVLVVGGFVWIVGSSHGHIDELLVVTANVVDRESARPLDGAVVAIVRYRSDLGREDFEQDLRDSLEEGGREDAWRFAPVAAARSRGEGFVTIRSAAWVTRYRLGPILTSKTMYGPQILLVDHPRLGRSIVPIHRSAPVPGSEPRTWRLDLGTVRVP